VSECQSKASGGGGGLDGGGTERMTVFNVFDFVLIIIFVFIF